MNRGMAKLRHLLLRRLLTPGNLQIPLGHRLSQMLTALPVETSAELGALLPAILDVACNGEL